MENAPKPRADTENAPPGTTIKFDTHKVSRRHSFVPTRSILKPITDDNNTIAVIPGSSSLPRERRRVSFAPEVTLHKITHYNRLSLRKENRRASLSSPIWRSILKKKENEMALANSKVAQTPSENENEEEDEDFSQSVSRVKVNIEEDNSTATMDATGIQVSDAPKVQEEDRRASDASSVLNAQDIFQDALKDIQDAEEDSMDFSLSNSQRTDDASDMELTQPVQTVSRIGVQAHEDATGMDFTGAVKASVSAPNVVEDEDTQTMEMTTQAHPAPIVAADDQTQTMEMTTQVPKVHTPLPAALAIVPDDETQTMDITKPSVDAESPAKRPLEADDEQENAPSAKRTCVEHESEEPSSAETSMVTTVMVPLAEVSTDSITDHADTTEGEENEDYDEDYYDDVTLSSFLKEIGVQFFDRMGPSDRELVVDDPDSPHSQANLEEYIKAVNSIPEFRYFEHLINQYRNSIKSIGKIVTDFEASVKENNPTSIREYYEQTDDLRKDLRINYQALAGYARQQAKSENLSYLIHLLAQLNKSYEHSSHLLDIQLEKVIKLRNSIMKRQQEMIDAKSSLKYDVDTLQSRYDSMSDAQRKRYKEISRDIKDKSEQRNELHKRINAIQVKISDLKPKFAAQGEAISKSKKEVDMLRGQLQGLQMPTEAEVGDLQKKFAEEEKRTQIKLVDLGDSEFTVSIMNDVEVNVNMVNGNRKVRIHNQSDEFSGFVTTTQTYLESLASPTIKDYLIDIRNHWTKFKALIRDLKIIKMRYQTSITGSGLEEVNTMTLYNRGHFKMTVSYRVTDLVHFDEQVNVKAELVPLNGQQYDKSAALEETVRKLTVNVPTMKRFVVAD